MGVGLEAGLRNGFLTIIREEASGQVCFICDGGTDEELLAEEFMRIALHGFTMTGVDSAPPWTYTIGLEQSFRHPELVITGLSAETAAELITSVVERIRTGARFDGSSPPLPLCGCTTVAFGAVHDSQWEKGRFNQWLNYYDWLAGDRPPRRAVQLLWAGASGAFPPDPEFCRDHGGRCQPLLDEAPRHDVNTGGNREQRRRAKYGHGQRKRR